jgi:transcriptional regulator with XRE-family HTH domain
MDDIRLILKENLKFYRKRAGLTQQKLAEACDVTTPYIGEVEIGRKHISMALIETMSRVLGIEPWKLLLPPQRREETLNMLLADELRESLSKAIEGVLGRPSKD